MKTSSMRMLAALIALGLASQLHAEPVVVGHPSLASQKLDAETTKAVLLGKKVTLGDTRVTIVIAKSSAAQDELLQSAIGMNTGQFQNHWRRLFMTGGGSAPKVVDSEAEAAKVANDIPGAIALLDSASAGNLPVLGNGK